MSRTHFDQLPDSEEIEKILEKEDKREIAETKQDVHYPEFGPAEALLDELGFTPNLFTETPENIGTFLEKGEKIIAELVPLILEGKAMQESLDQVYDYLSEQDELVPADLIFVFGNKQTNRIDKAIELYKAGYAPKILISGKGPFYGRETVSEAETLKEYAISKGVPVEDILIESESMSIPDNIKRSFNMFDRRHIKYDTVLSVMAPFAQRRAWAHLMKYSPEETRIVRVNSGLRPQFSRNEWFKSEEGIKVILIEYVKMMGAVLLNTA